MNRTLHHPPRRGRLDRASVSAPMFWARVVLFTFSSLAAALPASAANAAVDESTTSRALAALPQAGVKLPVTVYEVRSSVAEIDPRAAGDMFTTALIKSRRFRVMERQRLEQGAGRERALNAQGFTSGTTASQQLTGAGLVFEATFSEANGGKGRKEGGVALGGMSMGASSNADEIGLDVRVVNVATGEVLDAINVRKEIESSAMGFTGVGNLVESVAQMRGRSLRGLAPDASYQESRREGVDRALRSVIELAVLELTKHAADWIQEPQ